MADEKWVWEDMDTIKENEKSSEKDTCCKLSIWIDKSFIMIGLVEIYDFGVKFIKCT